MNFGPGALFPVVPAEAHSGPAFGPTGQPTIDSRFGAEFQAPPQYQNQPIPFNQYPPAQQFPQNRGADPRQTNLNQNDGQLGPTSPGSNWPVIQAAAASPGDTSQPRFNDPLERAASTQTSAWAEKPNLRGASPYNDAWPPTPPGSANGNGYGQGMSGQVNGGQNAGGPNGAMPNGGGPNSGMPNGGAPNSLPMWNGNPSAGRPQPKSFGPAGSNQPSNYPEQWPGNRR
jgi:hypothetical protein